MLVEPDDLGAGALRDSADRLVAPVQNGEIVCAGELDGAGLEVDVALEGAVAVEVIGRDVEDHAYVQARALDRLELKARQLQHDPVSWGDLIDAVEHRVADVAADDDRPRAGGEDAAGERGGGGLAIGSGDSDDGARARSKEQVDLAGHRDAALPRSHEQL